MLFILNRDYQVMGVADNTSEGALHYFNDKLTTDLTAGVSTFEFDVYKTNPTSAFLQEGNYITLKDTHGKQLLFTIMEMEEDSTKKSIYCEDVGLDLLNETVPPLKATTAQPISWYIQQSTNDSGWQIGTNQVSHLKRTLEYEGYSNALQRILSICNSFDGVEVDFTVEFKGNAVTKQLINIYRKRGKDSGLRYNAGIDLAEARRTVSLNDLATALRGVGSEITNKDNEVIGNTTFTNIVYDDGRYFTTKGSPFVFDREANKRWSRYRNMQSATQGYIVDYFSYDTKSEQELFNRALSQLKKRSEPAVEYEIEISKIKDNLMVGDTIEIVDNYFQPALHLQARVLAVTTSETVDSDNKLKLGNYKIIQSSIDEKLLALQAKLNSIKLSWSENNAPVLVVKSTNGEAFFNNYIDTNLNASIIRGGIDITNSYTSDEVVWRKRDRFGVNVSGWNRTGFSIPLSIEDINTKNTFVATVDGMEAQITIFNTLTTVESPTAPTEPQQGQIWLDTSVQPPIQKVYLGGKWKPVTPITEEQFEEVKTISELASSGVESLNGELATVKDNVAGKVDSNTYTQKVSAIESALANKVEQAIQQADKLALEGEIAKKVAQTAYDTKVSELNTAISGKVGTAIYNANKTLQDAEIAKKVAQTAYDTKVAELNTAIGKKLDTSVANANKVAQDAEIAKKVAQTTYNTKMNALDTAISGHTTRIEATETGLLAKASTTDVNALKTRMNTAETSLTTNANAIALKASQEDLDTIEGRLETTEAELVVQAGEIASKVAKTDFNNLSGRVGTAESTIIQHASEIASRVKQTDFDSLSGRVGTAESSITQQAGEIASKVATTTYNAGIATKENAITKANTAPAHSSGKLWLDTSVTPNVLKRSTGTAWVKVTPTTASEVGAYSSSAGSTLAGRVSTAESSITQQAGLIASKVAQTDFNALSSRVGTAESTITQQASQISLKASQSDLNALDGRLDTAEAEIVVQSGQIASKVSQSEFNAVEDRLGTAESSITQQAGEIASKVATTTYNAGIASKENAVIKSNTAPTHANGKLWLNTSVTPNVLNRSTGTAWVKATPTTASEVGAYSSSAGSALAGRVTTAESTITQQAGLIASKVSQTDFNGVNGRLNTAESTITQQAGEIALKASQEDLDTLNGRVETSETKIATNASQIALKASTSALNATNGRLSTAEGNITVNAQNIASKVSQTDFDAVEGRLDTAESTITQQAGLIESKVAKTTYDTDINNATTGLKKKMSNAESRITQTEKDIISKVSQTTYDADINNATTGLKKRISTAESTITQQAGLIESKVATTTYNSGLATKANASDVYKKAEVDTKVNAKADTSTVTALTTRVTNSESKITQTEKDIALRATKTEAQGYAKTAVDGIEVGGRNLLLKSNEEITNKLYPITTYKLSEKMIAGKEYTIRLWGTLGAGKTNFTPYLNGGSISLGALKNNGDGTFSLTFVGKDSGVTTGDILHIYPMASTTSVDSTITKIKLEKGNKATDWAPAPEDVQEEINAIETRVNDAELLITPEAITATVVESEDLINKLEGYATQESLGNYLSNEDFTTEKDNIIGEIDSKIGAIDYSPFVQTSELEQKTNALTAKISQAGGVNLIQNSIGWAGKDFWSNFSATAGVSIQNDELSSMGFGSGWYSSASGAFNQKQRLTLPRAGTYTLSFWLKKTVGSSWAYVQVQKGDDTTFANANAFAYAGYSGTRLTDGYELFTTTFEATELDVAVSININTGVEATITGIMLHEGSEPFKWQPYTSEVYNTNVKMDINGITVKNNQDAGYTLITPDEFSGYAPVNGTVERVFTLNGDTTEVKKLKAEQQFEMAPVTIITIDNLKYSGWAFI